MIAIDGAALPSARAAGWGSRHRAALVALIFVLSHFGGLSHFAAVRHTVCDEHGRIEHGAPAGGPGHVESVDAPVRFANARSAASDEHHDGCHLSFLTGASSFTRPASPSRPTVDVTGIRARLDRSPRALSSIPVLLLAPKHSPPSGD